MYGVDKETWPIAAWRGFPQVFHSRGSIALFNAPRSLNTQTISNVHWLWIRWGYWNGNHSHVNIINLTTNLCALRCCFGEVCRFSIVPSLTSNTSLLEFCVEFFLLLDCACVCNMNVCIYSMYWHRRKWLLPILTWNLIIALQGCWNQDFKSEVSISLMAHIIYTWLPSLSWGVFMHYDAKILALSLR